MRQLFFALLLASIAACNNNSTPSGNNADSAKKASALPIDSAEKESEMNFIDGCIGNAKLTLGEEKAYSFCKCLYAQTKTRYPDMDSAKIAALDTAEVARMAANCR